MMNEIRRIVSDKDFLCSLGISEEIIITEIRKGKVNHVFKVTDLKQGISFIIKKSENQLAGLKLPIIKGINISTVRNHNEAKSMQYISRNISDKYVPKVITVNEKESFFVMEFLEGYEDIRDILLNMKVPKDFSKILSNILADIYIKTANVTDKTIGIENRCMIDILIMLLIKAPYEISMVKANKELVDVEFFINALKSKELLPYVIELSYKLKNCRQVLLNGDLHLGSIFCKETNYKIYDYEFAFKGPIGYEIGKIIAHIILAYYYAYSRKNYMMANELLCHIIIFFNKMTEKIEAIGSFDISDIKEDIIKFCGLELISRITGILQLKYITTIRDSTIKDNMQKTIFKMASEMIKGELKVTCGKELAEYVQR